VEEEMIKGCLKVIDFKLCNAQNETVKLSSFLGKFVILYFYPKALTSGCIKEA
jgi:peroxiredoxin Q/BCP